jgi:hypothetical protein
MSAILLLIFFKNKILFFLILEEKYNVIRIVQEENCAGFKKLNIDSIQLPTSMKTKSALRLVVLRLAELYPAVYLPSIYSSSQE